MKTLKDLKEYIAEYESVDEVVEGLIKKEELRQAAIEWIKAMEKFMEENDTFHGCTFKDGNLELYEECENSDISGTVMWVKHFFNITEEDLK